MELLNYNFLWGFNPLKCPLARLGFCCPTCGLGHSLLAALRGEFSESYALHFAGIPILLVGGLICLGLMIKPQSVLQARNQFLGFFKGRPELQVGCIVLYSCLSFIQKF